MKIDLYLNEVARIAVKEYHERLTREICLVRKCSSLTGTQMPKAVEEYLASVEELALEIYGTIGKLNLSEVGDVDRLRNLSYKTIDMIRMFSLEFSDYLRVIRCFEEIIGLSNAIVKIADCLDSYFKSERANAVNAKAKNRDTDKA